MSEFSESFHVRGEKQEDGISLLRKAGLGGAAFAPTRGWVTVVPRGELYEGVEALAAVNGGTMLHYLFAEDHGWQFTIYRGREAVCQYSCGWDPEFSVDDSKLDHAILEEIASGAACQAEIDDILHPAGIDALLDLSVPPPAYRFAQLLGLEHYEWLCGDYIDEAEEMKERDALVIIVE